MTIKMILENRMNITDSVGLAYEEERISKNKTASYILLIYFITHIKKVDLEMDKLQRLFNCVKHL